MWDLKKTAKNGTIELHKLRGPTAVGSGWLGMHDRVLVSVSWVHLHVSLATYATSIFIVPPEVYCWAALEGRGTEVGRNCAFRPSICRDGANYHADCGALPICARLHWKLRSVAASAIGSDTRADSGKSAGDDAATSPLVLLIELHRCCPLFSCPFFGFRPEQ